MIIPWHFPQKLLCTFPRSHNGMLKVKHRSHATPVRTCPHCSRGSWEQHPSRELSGIPHVKASLMPLHAYSNLSATILNSPERGSTNRYKLIYCQSAFPSALLGYQWDPCPAQGASPQEIGWPKGTESSCVLSRCRSCL